MKNLPKDTKKSSPALSEKINALKKKMELLKKKAKDDEIKRLNGQRMKLHKLVASFVANGWPEDYETLKSNITTIIEE